MSCNLGTLCTFLCTLHSNDTARTHALASPACNTPMGASIVEDFELNMAAVSGGKLYPFSWILDCYQGVKQTAKRYLHTFYEAYSAVDDIFQISHLQCTCQISLQTIAVTTRLARLRGIMNFQEKFMSWSNLTRGKVQRTHMITNITTYVLKRNQNTPGI